MQQGKLDKPSIYSQSLQSTSLSLAQRKKVQRYCHLNAFGPNEGQAAEQTVRSFDDFFFLSEVNSNELLGTAGLMGNNTKTASFKAKKTST